MFGKLRRVNKAWGHELWLHNSPLYCGKVLVVMPGKQLSYHYHEDKHETFAVIEGRALIYLGERNESFYCVGDWHVLEPGTTVEISPYMVHSVKCAGDEPVRIMEVSTQHRDSDSYRMERTCGT